MSSGGGGAGGGALSGRSAANAADPLDANARLTIAAAPQPRSDFLIFTCNPPYPPTRAARDRPRAHPPAAPADGIRHERAQSTRLRWSITQAACQHRCATVARRAAFIAES